jgi:hypothetical protein
VLRVQVVGVSPLVVRARVWRVGSVEPSSWLVVSSSGVAGVPSSGWVGVRGVNTTRSASTVTFDNLNAEQFAPPVDHSPPTVVDCQPASGTGGVPPTSTVRATFSEDIAAASLTPATFTLTKQGGAGPVNASVAYDESDMTATLSPSQSLEPGATYVATVKGGSAGVKDQAGNALAADVSWSFTTSTSSTAVVDGFSRVVSGGFGVADVGGVWSVVGGGSGVSVDGVRGRLAVAGGGVSGVELRSVVVRDVDARVEVGFPSLVPFGGVSGWLVVRGRGDGSQDRVGVVVIAQRRK